LTSIARGMAVRGEPPLRSLTQFAASSKFFVSMNKTKQRVLLGMSGGVDSSVAGYLLREQG
jgi:NH3-dependent NAD+ synthetase